MDERQKAQINEVAEKFTGAIRDSYQAVADRSVSVREFNAQLTQQFFDGVMDNLTRQAESNRALAEDLIAQQQMQREATQAMAQETVGEYMAFLNTMFSHCQGNLDPARDAAEK